MSELHCLSPHQSPDLTTSLIRFPPSPSPHAHRCQGLYDLKSSFTFYPVSSLKGLHCAGRGLLWVDFLAKVAWPCEYLLAAREGVEVQMGTRFLSFRSFPRLQTTGLVCLYVPNYWAKLWPTKQYSSRLEWEHGEKGTWLVVGIRQCVLPWKRASLSILWDARKRTLRWLQWEITFLV